MLGLLCCGWPFSSCNEQGLLSSFVVWASHCSGFSVAEHRLYGVQVSGVVAHGVSSRGSRASGHRLNDCGTPA